MITLHIAGVVFVLIVIAVVLGVAVLAICAAIQSGANDEPHVPADVDLEQALATTRGIAYGCSCVNGPSRGVLHRPDCPMTGQRRARGYARSRV